MVTVTANLLSNLPASIPTSIPTGTLVIETIIVYSCVPAYWYACELASLYSLLIQRLLTTRDTYSGLVLLHTLLLGLPTC